MLRILVGFLFLAVISAKITPDSGKIVGGHDADIKEYPYQLSLSRVTSHFCGAALLNEYYAITAAHCTMNRKASDLVLRAGSSIRNQKGKYLFVEEIFQHPKFSMENIDNDVSVLKLKFKVVFTPEIQPIKLPEANANFEGKVAISTGWGYLKAGGPPSEMLQAVELNVYSTEVCKSIYHEKLTEHMMCVGEMAGGKDACQGDSGGPLVVDGVLIGIVSWGYGCAEPGKPGIFTKVTSELDFIKESMQS